jgi:hypothetical protein
VGAFALVGAVALHVRDPHESGSWGICPFTLLTGLDCPACGSLRAVNLLTNFDLAGAASSNLLLVIVVPIAFVFWVRRLVACWRGGEAMRPLRIPTYVWVGLIGLVAVFTVLRNLPGSWLAA